MFQFQHSKTPKAPFLMSQNFRPGAQRPGRGKPRAQIKNLKYVKSLALGKPGRGRSKRKSLRDK